MESPIESEMPTAFWQGIQQFNQQEFYACHDTLEAIWMEAEAIDKKFYQGILQVAVALYHFSNENWQGAVILMGEGLGRLQSYPSNYGDIDLDTFIVKTGDLLSSLQQAGPEAAIAWVQAGGFQSQTSTENQHNFQIPTISRIKTDKDSAE